MDKLCELSVNTLVPPKVLLRPVEQNSVDYLEMKDSVENEGILNSISVRPCACFPGKFEIIDGMYRWTCANEIGLQTIPAIIKHDVSDDDALLLQIQANAVRPATSPCDFAKQLRRIQKTNPQITVPQIASLVSKSPAWIQQQLGLLQLRPDQQKMVNRGEICLQNAYMLVRIPPRLRSDFIDRAKVMKANQFSILVANMVKRFREAVRQGRLDAYFTEEFEPQPHLRSLKEIQEESNTQNVGPLIITADNCKTSIDGWNAALQWMMHLDHDSVQEQKVVWLSQRRKKE